MAKSNIEEFIKDLIVLFIFSLSAFWILITGVYLIPQIISNSDGLTPFFYSLGTLSFSVMVMYVGLKYLNLLGKKK